MAYPAFPRKEADRLAMMQTFAGTISAQPSVYMITPQEAAAIQQAVDLFAATYSRVLDPVTRGVVTVCAKDEARNNAEQLCRLYYSLIKPNAGISDADKIAIGVNPVNRSRTPIQCPQTSPLINIIAGTPGVHTLRYSDSMTPTSSGKPFGAIQLQLFVAIGETRANDPGEAQFYRDFTVNPMSVAFKAEDDGKLASYFGRWSSRRGDVGPWSLPASMRIAA
jgi:hypothetical protein